MPLHTTHRNPTHCQSPPVSNICGLVCLPHSPLSLMNFHCMESSPPPPTTTFHPLSIITISFCTDRFQDRIYSCHLFHTFSLGRYTTHAHTHCVDGQFLCLPSQFILYSTFCCTCHFCTFSCYLMFFPLLLPSPSHMPTAHLPPPPHSWGSDSASLVHTSLRDSAMVCTCSAFVLVPDLTSFFPHYTQTPLLSRFG